LRVVKIRKALLKCKMTTVLNSIIYGPLPPLRFSLYKTKAGKQQGDRRANELSSHATVVVLDSGGKVAKNPSSLDCLLIPPSLDRLAQGHRPCARRSDPCRLDRSSITSRVWDGCRRTLKESQRFFSIRAGDSPSS
jgi:hypothetical protein